MRYLSFLFLCLALAIVPAGLVRAESGHVPHKKPAAEDKTLIPEIQPIVTTYDVYVGGIHLLTADILFEQMARKYRAQVKGQTYGFWYKILPWNTELNAEGKIRDDQFIPAEYATHDVWGKKTKIMKMHFRKGGDVSSEYDPPSSDKDSLTREQKDGALDPITALLQMLAHVAINKNCNVTVPVFDGKRRFDVSASDNGTEYIDEEDYGVYKGDARTCDARFKAVAGEWTEKIKSKFWKQGANGEDREPFHVWLASLAPGMPEMAVRIETGSVWGDIVMHLAKWRPAGPEDSVMPPPAATRVAEKNASPMLPKHAKGKHVADTQPDAAGK